MRFNGYCDHFLDHLIICSRIEWDFVKSSWINCVIQIIQEEFIFFKTTDLLEISDKNVFFTSTSCLMTFALATTEFGFSTYIILLLSSAIWLGAPAYFLFKSGKGQKSAFYRN